MNIDLHLDTSWLFTKHNGCVNLDTQGTINDIQTVSFLDMKTGGVDAAVFTLYLSDAWQDDNYTDEGNAIEGFWVRLIQLHASET